MHVYKGSCTATNVTEIIHQCEKFHIFISSLKKRLQTIVLVKIL